MIEYYNENENRAYPLDENSTREAADGTALPDAVLADLRLTVPKSVYGSLYVSSVVITPALASVAIAYASGGVAVGAWAQPVTPHIPYPLTGLMGMVSGHVVFGTGGTGPAVRFTAESAAASGLDVRAQQPIEDTVVTSLGRYRALDRNRLYGIVKLVAGNNVTIRYHDGKIKVGLVEAVRGDFVGPCDQQAIFNNCGRPPIRTINGVGPDGTGAITIEVDNTYDA